MNSLSQHLTIQLRFLVALTLLLTSSALYADVPTKFSLLQDWKGVKNHYQQERVLPQLLQHYFPGQLCDHR